MSVRKQQEAKEQPPAKKGKLWGGRFSGKTDPLFEAFNASIDFDKTLWSADIRGSQAYSKALANASVITTDECKTLVEGLTEVGKEWASDTFVINRDTDEDIHTANERRLGELVGKVAGKLHTGRSRNDQVATDVRLWVADKIINMRTLLKQLISTAVERAENEGEILMPGFTHLQPAQPIRWSHWIMSHAWAWERDLQRLNDLEKRVRVSPLGSGALAGNPFGVDRLTLAQDLGFEAISPNSLDAVCNRDFIAEFLFWATMTQTHISQWAEDLIIFCTKKFVTCADAYSTGSSLMPQKKNPDALELLRGKVGRVSGALTNILVLLKGLPRAYNKDLQEDKEPLFDAARTMEGCLGITAGVLATLTIHPENMTAGLVPEMLATDLAEYLVRKGVPFRDTHHVAGAAVKLAEDKKAPLNTLTVKDLQTLHPKFEDDVVKVWDFRTSVESRDAAGGTSKSSLDKQIKDLKEIIAAKLYESN